MSHTYRTNKNYSINEGIVLYKITYELTLKKQKHSNKTEHTFHR